MRDLCCSRLPKLYIDLGEGEDFPFFRREGGGFRRSPKEYRDRRCDRRYVAAVTFISYSRDRGEYKCRGHNSGVSQGND